MSKKVKIALATPEIRLCDVEYNVVEHIRCAEEAESHGADIIAFPELSLTGKTAGDLFLHSTLTDAAARALFLYAQRTEQLSLISFVGFPLVHDGKIYNAVAGIAGGEILGISLAPIEDKVFAKPLQIQKKIELLDEEITMGDALIFECSKTGARIFVEVGRMAPDNPTPALLGANIVINAVALAEDITLGIKRKQAAYDASRKLNCTYAIVGAGIGESGTDGIYAAPRVAFSSGECLLDAPLFADDVHYFDTDTDTVIFEEHEQLVFPVPQADTKTPFYPYDEATNLTLFDTAIELQARALAKRMERAYAKCAVLGVSGGLDSTLALLVCERAARYAGLAQERVIAITMPCFGTTERTKSNALSLAEKLGCTVRTIDIKAAVMQHFSDISHNPENYDVVYENAQARERTQILMDIANAEGGLVVGTGDLSELALGFATYNGDHMSMYAVNATVPKTLMRRIIERAADVYDRAGRADIAAILLDVVNTPVSPELLPATDGEQNSIQSTEQIVGPYELHDFFLYHFVKELKSAPEILACAVRAFQGRYDESEIRKYLKTFVNRFFSQQFKRSCMPDGPRVSEITLSPRSGFCIPSDVSGTLFKNF